MASGTKEMVFNSLERILSNDMNRLQKFAAAANAELFRHMLNDVANDDLESGGVVTESTSIASPLKAEIINGLLVRPQSGTFDIKIDPGVMFAIAPDGAADDAGYKYVKDPGVVAGGVLVLTTNVAGPFLTRIDVIECQVSSLDTEVDNRDLYNPITGLFTVSTITKAREHRLTYRIRQGIAGSGWPGTASGWLPLCVVAVPNGATNNDACTFWDVRPLLADREFQPFANARSNPHNIRANVYWRPASKTNGTPVNGDFPLRGVFEATLKGRRIGGILRRGTPGADADTTDPLHVDNKDQGTTLVDGDLANIYLCLPFGLPRWARYTATGARLPRSPRGILLTSKHKPDELGHPASAILLPANSGLGLSAQPSECLFVGFGHFGNFVVGPDTFEAYSGFQLVGNEMWNQYNSVGLATGSGGMLSPTVIPSGTQFDSADFDLVPGTHFPKNAKSIHCSLVVSGNMLEGTPGMVDVTVYEPGSTTVGIAVYQCPRVMESHSHTGNGVVGSNASIAAQLWLPIPHPYPGVWGATMRVRFRYEMSSGAPFAITLNIRGWRF